MVLGKQTVKNVEISEIVIYKLDKKREYYQIEKQMEFAFDDFTCCQFFFDCENSDELIFFTATEVFKFKYKEKEDQEQSLYTLSNWLLDPPNFGIFSKDQQKCIITSCKDILYVNLKTGFEMDIDEQENISDVCNILADEKYFYILANKKADVLGYFLLMIEIDHPEKEAIYLINWTNKLSIRQVDLNFMEDYNDDKKLQKYLVVSYKAAGSNTFNVFVFDVQT